MTCCDIGMFVERKATVFSKKTVILPIPSLTSDFIWITQEETRVILTSIWTGVEWILCSKTLKKP